MDKKQLKIAIKKIRMDTERKLGLLNVPESIYNYIENSFFAVEDEDYLDEYRKLLPVHLIKFASILENYTINFQSNAPSDEIKFKKKKCFNRRLHLVTFVSDKVLNLDNFEENSLKPSKRINWKLTCDEWNKTHPYDIMTIEVLKREYFRARLEIDIQREYFKRKHDEFDTVFEPIRKVLGLNVDKEQSLGDSWIDSNLEYEKRMDIEKQS